MPQTSPQFSSWVGELVSAVRMIRGLRHGEIECCAERLSLDLKEIAEKPVKQLSGSMKQKLSLALALAPRATLLVLDEPTASLDAESQVRFYEMLRERREGTTLILSSSVKGNSLSGAGGPFPTSAGDFQNRAIRGWYSVVRSTRGRSMKRHKNAVLLLAGWRCYSWARPSPRAGRSDSPQPVAWDQKACAECPMLIGDQRFVATSEHQRADAQL